MVVAVAVEEAVVEQQLLLHRAAERPQRVQHSSLYMVKESQQRCNDAQRVC